jgi:hypothetical protein
MEVTEGEIEVGEISTLWTAWLVAGIDAKKGKHRTEVTEGKIEERYPRYGQHGLWRETTRKRGSMALGGY